MIQSNGSHSFQPSNGASSPGIVVSNGKGSQPNAAPPQRPIPFDQPVILRQTPIWTRAIVWSIVTVTGFSIAWACLAEMDQAVQAQGKLEPQGQVKAVQAPIGGVVQSIEVEEGQRVAAGQVLMRLDTTTSQAEAQSLRQIRESLVAQNQFYESQMRDTPSPPDPSVLQHLPQPLAALTGNRLALVEENRLFRAQLGQAPLESLDPGQQQRFIASQAERLSRESAAALEVDQLNRQLAQTLIQLANSQDVLAINQQILDDVDPLLQAGGLARVQYLRLQQEVGNSQAEVTRLVQEEERLQVAIAQAGQRLQNTKSLTQGDLLTKIADNEKRIADIDSQLTRILIDNQKQIQDIDSQLSRANTTLLYQELRAPVGGTVFDLQPAAPGFVTTTSEPLLKIVPENSLVAKVFITNKDIGFVEPGMPVDVRIDSFPFSEFGDVKGRLVRIGTDALPPDQIYPFYRFPADIVLDTQFITINGRDINLLSGMSVSSNIKVRRRKVINAFTDLFTEKVDSLKTVR
jgi:hemolysin D